MKLDLVFVFLVSIVLMFLGKETKIAYPFASHIMSGTAEALIISIIVIFLVEKRAKKHLFEEITKATDELKVDAFVGGFGHGLPNEYITALKNLIIDAKITRENFILKFKLTDSLLENDTVIILEGSVSYTLVNHSDNFITHNIRSKIENSIIPGYKKFQRFKSMSIDGIPTDTSELVIDESESHQKIYCKTIEIPKKGKRNVEWQYALRKLTAGNEPFMTSLPAKNLTIIFEHPANYEVGISAFHLIQPIKIESTNSEQSVWKLNSPILPHQGVCIFWSKIEAA